MTPAEQQQVGQAVLTPPRELGYPFANWTGKLARHHAEVQFGKILSVRTLIRVLRRQGLAPLRPRPVPAKGNPEKQQVFFDDLRARIQRAGPDDHFLFIDACTLQRCATITRMWGRRGQQPVVKMEGRGEKVNVYGALDVNNDIGNFFFTPKITAAHVCSYIRHLVIKYPTGKLHLILDNVSAHHAKMTQACVAALAPFVELIFLPPYSPKLNPIEKFWELLRKRMTYNVCFPSLLRLKIDIAKFLSQFTVPSAEIRSLYKIYFKQGPFPVSAL